MSSATVLRKLSLFRIFYCLKRNIFRYLEHRTTLDTWITEARGSLPSKKMSKEVSDPKEIIHDLSKARLKHKPVASEDLSYLHKYSKVFGYSHTLQLSNSPILQLSVPHKPNKPFPNKFRHAAAKETPAYVMGIWKEIEKG